jgi:hypothetical protein
VAAEHLGEGEHQVGGGGAGGQCVVEAHPDHHRGEQEEGLAQHAGLGLDAADTPAEDACAVHHGGVGVGADHGVGDSRPDPIDLADGDRLGEVLEVDLVDDAHPRGHHAEAAERLLRPPQEGVALVVALVLALDVAPVRVGAAERVHLHRVVDDQVDGDQGIDPAGVASRALDGAAHGGEVDHGGDSGEVLEQNPGGNEGPLPVALGRPAVPAGQRDHVVVGDESVPGVPEQVLEEDLHGHRQPRDVADAPLGEGLEPVVGEATGKLGASPEAILRHGHLTSTPVLPASPVVRVRTARPGAPRAEIII